MAHAYRLQHRRSTFDSIAAMSVEGVNKSSIARVLCMVGTLWIVGWRKLVRFVG